MLITIKVVDVEYIMDAAPRSGLPVGTVATSKISENKKIIIHNILSVVMQFDCNYFDMVLK